MDGLRLSSADGIPRFMVFLPEDDSASGQVARELAQKLALVAIRFQSKRGGLLISTINGAPAGEHFLARFLEDSGFVPTALGFQMRRVQRPRLTIPDPAEDVSDEEDA